MNKRDILADILTGRVESASEARRRLGITRTCTVIDRGDPTLDLFEDGKPPEAIERENLDKVLAGFDVVIRASITNPVPPVTSEDDLFIPDDI